MRTPLFILALLFSDFPVPIFGDKYINTSQPLPIRQPRKPNLLGSVERRVEGGTLAGHVFSRRLVHLRHGHWFRRAARHAQRVNKPSIAF